MYKRRTFFIITVVLLLAGYWVGQAVGGALPEPGSDADPLVTKSYVDNYINQKYLELKEQAEYLAAEVYALEQKVAELRQKVRPPLRLTIGQATAYIGGQPVTLDVPPFIEKGRTMLPFRFIGEALGAQMGWDEATRTVSYSLGQTVVEIPIGSLTARVNGKETALDVPAKLVQGRTLVPVRFISAQLGATVAWDEATKTVTITP